MVAKTIVATVVQKGDDGPARRCYIIVRSSAIAVDTVITVSHEDYNRLHAGMLVKVHRIGWSLFSTWRLTR